MLRPAIKERLMSEPHLTEKDKEFLPFQFPDFVKFISVKISLL